MRLSRTPKHPGENGVYYSTGNNRSLGDNGDTGICNSEATFPVAREVKTNDSAFFKNNVLVEDCLGYHCVAHP